MTTLGPRSANSTASQNASKSAAPDETNDKENQKNSVKRDEPSKDRRRQLQTMTALMDMEHEEMDKESPSSSANQHRRNSNRKEGLFMSATDDSKVESVAVETRSLTDGGRRQMLTVDGQVAASLLAPLNQNNVQAVAPAWDGFVRKGTRLKSFLDDALQHVATGYTVTNIAGTKRQRVAEGEREGTRDAVQLSRQQQPWEEGVVAASTVAKDKTTEVLVLQQKLEESQAQVVALTASNNTLREETAASSLRFERTIEALKIAAANAASARTDADQAEASSEGLSTQLEALQTVVQQTKEASMVLYEEQQEIAEQARTSQVKLLQTEADLAKSMKETKQLRDQTKQWEDKAKQLQEESMTLKRQLADHKEGMRKLSKAIEERDALEFARKERSKQIEQELRDAQALLLNATSAAAENETMEVLKDSILELQAANKKLHELMQEQQETTQEEKKRLQESLLEAEKQAQELRIQASLNNEQNNSNSEDHDGKKAVSPEVDVDNSFIISRPASMSSPNGSDAVPTASICSICFKKAFGIMKTCQCGMDGCELRAHLTCANRKNPGPSVSHPGTPGAKLPVILCAGPLANLQKKD